MKTLGKIVGAILIGCALLLVILRFTGLNPRARTPGLWLTGKVVNTPVTDWSFTDKVQHVEVQVRTWYLLPHSVTINCISNDGRLYLSSVFGQDETRSWNAAVLRDPRVRIKVGDQLYDRTLVPVTDPAEWKAVLEARARKYPRLKIPRGATVHIFRVTG